VIRTSENQLFCCKSIDKLISDSRNQSADKEDPRPVSLTALGIGAVIGSGIFTVIGTAIAGQKLIPLPSSTAPLLDYLIKHTASLGRPAPDRRWLCRWFWSRLSVHLPVCCYARTGFDDPIAGSAYTYTYAPWAS